MSSTIIRRATIVSVAGAVLLALLLTPPRTRAATLYACVKRNGTAHLYVRKPRCRHGETRLFWNTTGPAGKDGATGVKGEQGLKGEPGSEGESGPSATSLWAVVNVKGELVRASSAVVSATALVEPGSFEVVFNRDVTACAYIATLGSPEAGSTFAGMVAVATRLGNPDGVFVQTFAEKGRPTAQSFHLAVFC